jgi:hypothetical protein
MMERRGDLFHKMQERLMNVEATDGTIETYRQMEPNHQ